MYDGVETIRLILYISAMWTRFAQQRFAVIALAVFFIAIASGELYRFLPTAAANTLWKTSWIVLCLLGLLLAHRMSPAAALGELGLREIVWSGVGATFLASLPMLLVLAVTARVDAHLSISHLFLVAAFGPFTEEVLFRGYLFRQLYRRAEWGFVPAVVVTAFLFGLAHLRAVLGKGNFRLVLSEVAITGIGGAFFAWLFMKWRDNLWVPFTMHASMNLWWELFSISDNAVGTRPWLGIGARFLTIVAAAVLTFLWSGKSTKARGGNPHAVSKSYGE